MPRVRTSLGAAAAVAVAAALTVASTRDTTGSTTSDPAALASRARQIFAPLPAEATSERNPITEAKIDLGRKLYFDTRFSRSQTISCNSCHQLDRFGVDGEPTSEGHRGQRGDRNSPTVYNAAFHVAQFWDGRAPDVEEQAKGPVLNPVEMAMPSEDAVIAVIRSIPGYGPLFAAAFPGEKDPIRYDNFAKAIGAFERRLVTPGRFDSFLAGDTAALTPEEQQGLATFLEVGCTACHTGPTVGGKMFQKTGVVHPYPTSDTGRERVTKKAADAYQFKVPSLRNIAMTAPYFHDGKVETLDEAVRLMAWHQLGRELAPEQKAAIVAFLGALTGEIPAGYVSPPELPASGPSTPKPGT